MYSKIFNCYEYKTLARKLSLVSVLVGCVLVGQYFNFLHPKQRFGGPSYHRQLLQTCKSKFTFSWIGVTFSAAAGESKDYDIVHSLSLPCLISSLVFLGRRCRSICRSDKGPPNPSGILMTQLRADRCGAKNHKTCRFQKFSLSTSSLGKANALLAADRHGW